MGVIRVEETGRSSRAHRAGLLGLTLGLILALIATVTLTSNADARVSGDYQTSRGEQVRINDDGTWQIDPTGTGRAFGAPQALEDVIRFRTGEVHSTDASSDLATEAGQSGVYIIQFETDPLASYLEEVTRLGGTIHRYVPENAYLVELSAASVARVAGLPYVKQTYRYDTQYKIDPALDSAVRSGPALPAVYELALFETGPEQVDEVSAVLRSAGAQPTYLSPESGRIVVELTAGQVDLALSLDQVEYLDTWAESEIDVDNTREVSGANALENIAGYTGQGIRGASWDTGLDDDHREFVSNPPLVQSNLPASSARSHGTSAFGIIFADGLQSGYRGLLPDGEGIAAAGRTSAPGYLSKPDFYRYAEANQAVFVTSSTGSPRTQVYTATSQAIDQALFDTDILALQSQSNAGSDEFRYEKKRDSRPEAWAKNVLSVGGITHGDNADITDDQWDNDGSIGPADDGRIKPDLSFYFDRVRSTTAAGGYTEQFGGTSAATPTTAGYIGLLFQLWADGVFRPNAAGINSPIPGLNRNAFSAKPRAATMRALAINTAYDYPFSGTGQVVANTRVHQGWGRIDVRAAYDRSLSGNMPLIVDETVLLRSGGPAQRYVVSTVGGSNCEFRSTMVYTDPPASPAAATALVNNLSLRVTAPNGTQYWGNNGLLAGNWSTPGGLENRVDTVENVFVNNAPAGDWIVDVIPTQINLDAHRETAAIDADFGLVVSGSCMGSARIAPAPTAVPPTATRVPPTATRVPPTATRVPPTATRVPPTATRVPPTSTRVPPTATRIPPTSTRVPPTATRVPPTPTVPPGLPSRVVYLENFETNGWEPLTAAPAASSGAWAAADPQGTTAPSGETMQLEDARVGRRALVTAGLAGRSVGANDVDGGVVARQSPPIALPAGAPSITLQLASYFHHLETANRADFFRLQAVGPSGSVVLLEQLGTALVRSGGWERHTLDLTQFAGQSIRLQVFASDGADTGTILEAGLDDLRIVATSLLPPTSTPTPIPPTTRPVVIPTTTSVLPTTRPVVIPTTTPLPPQTVLLRENFESGSPGWVVNPNGTDTGTSGQWSASNPGRTTYANQEFQPESSTEGLQGLFTDGRAGRRVGDYDVDGGVVTIKSPTFRVPLTGATVNFDWFFAHYDNVTDEDFLKVTIVGPQARQALLGERGNGSVRPVEWKHWRSVVSSNLFGQDVYLLIEAADGGNGNLVEAGFDDLIITSR